MPMLFLFLLLGHGGGHLAAWRRSLDFAIAIAGATWRWAQDSPTDATVVEIPH